VSLHRFTSWAREYGEIFSLKIGSQTVVVLSSAQAVHEVMDKNSGVTADRPPNHFVNIMTDGLNLVLCVPLPCVFTVSLIL
jgi:hypothetical protein